LRRAGLRLFLIKTYQMITTCRDDLAAWSDDGKTFVVKNTAQFAKIEIPNYFDHSNFSSFSRQLNFYGFKKVPNKTIRIDQYDKSTAGYVRFFNEKFIRGRTDLLNQIQRSTKSTGNGQNQAQEIKTLKEKVSSLELQLSKMKSEMKSFKDEVRNLLKKNKHGDQNGKREYEEQGAQMQPSVKVSQAGGEAHGVGFNEYPDSHMSQQYSDSQWSNNGTLEPHPNAKKVDPNQLPPRPGLGTNRNESLLRGFSGGFDESLFPDEPERVHSSAVTETMQGKMMARIQSLDISGVYQTERNDEELQPVDYSPVGV